MDLVQANYQTEIIMARSSHSRRKRRPRSASRRHPGIEQLEDRRLLTTAALDDFESGNFSGGSEQWATGAWIVSGDAAIRTNRDGGLIRVVAMHDCGAGRAICNERSTSEVFQMSSCSSGEN